MNKATTIFNVISLSLDKFENYEAVFEGYLLEEREKLQKMWSYVEPYEWDGDILRGGSPDGYIDFLNEYSTDVEIHFTNTFRASFLIQMMSLIEYHLKYVCEIHSKFSIAGYKLDDLAGNDLDKCKIYLQKSCGVNFTVVNDEWNFIKSMYRVRNKFVHHSGLLNKKDTEGEIETLSKQGYFTIEEIRDTGHFTLRFESNMNAKLLSLTKIFFEKLTKSLMSAFTSLK